MSLRAEVLSEEYKDEIANGTGRNSDRGNGETPLPLPREENWESERLKRTTEILSFKERLKGAWLSEEGGTIILGITFMRNKAARF